MIGCLGHYPMLLPNFMKCVLSGLSARRVSLDPAKPLCDPCVRSWNRHQGYSDKGATGLGYGLGAPPVPAHGLWSPAPSLKHAVAFCFSGRPVTSKCTSPRSPFKLFEAWTGTGGSRIFSVHMVCNGSNASEKKKPLPLWFSFAGTRRDEVADCRRNNKEGQNKQSAASQSSIHLTYGVLACLMQDLLVVLNRCQLASRAQGSGSLIQAPAQQSWHDVRGTRGLSHRSI